ncbi:hypothetical protein [Moraxella equi]|uniref:Uncharacterized protein n=1 Tax=Moraxella equi TaxID=60442 RepID=A0A378QX18_9GAMM|nr:hypothetical protein [Moraxella equi]OPH39766.1 hypothetical protein B5J93_02375 [Moraxella equi]STZ03983.1 Uncharacterised protein [Moraxella equi]
MNGNNKNKYPTLKVILSYALLGSLVGTLPIIPVLIYAIIIGDDVENTLFIYAVILMVGTVIGFIPALITGCMLSYFKVRILKVKDYLKAFFFGLLTTFSFLLIILATDFMTDVNALVESIDDFFSSIFLSFWIAIIGGLSSTILAKFILPKS